MYYAIWAEDAYNVWPQRKATREAHLARVQPLIEQGRVLLVGPMPNEDSATPTNAGMFGSLLVIDFDSLQQAKQWAHQDPYFEAGVYKRVTVKPFIQVV